MHFRLMRLFAGFAAGLGLFAASAARANVVYGNFDGPNVDYTNVTETPTQLPPPNPPYLFGAPTLNGDSLDFTNTGFDVAVSGGSFEFQDGRLSMGISAANQQQGNLTSLLITEGGGWAVDGSGSTTYASESLLINGLTIVGINGNSVNPIPVPYTESFTYTKSGTANVVTTSTGITFDANGSFSNGTWNGMAGFNIEAALMANDIQGRVTSLSLTLNDQLFGTSVADDSVTSLAFIDKKFFDVTAGGPPVPEPAGASLALLATLALTARRRTN
jgi:hypothetical protein